jgi:hypothetical protein
MYIQLQVAKDNVFLRHPNGRERLHPHTGIGRTRLGRQNSRLHRPFLKKQKIRFGPHKPLPCR